ncbi:MAG: HAD family hydrolase, partial [Rhodospirillales bacterium]|nr:HAD family hydrolase [Rhodospirillales bacterium]
MGNNLKRPPAVLFDWDDTLIDNWESIHSALNKTLTAMGHETWPIERTRKQVRQSMRNSFPQLFGDKWETAADIFYDHIKADHLQRAEVAYLGWDNFFTAIVGAGDAAQDKPEPDPIYLCLNGSGINSNESGWPHIWFVGDAPSDLECANKAGVTSVLLCKKPYPVE